MTTAFHIVTSVSFRCRPIWGVLSPILESSDAKLAFGGMSLYRILNGLSLINSRFAR